MRPRVCDYLCVCVCVCVKQFYLTSAFTVQRYSPTCDVAFYGHMHLLQDHDQDHFFVGSVLV